MDLRALAPHRMFSGTAPHLARRGLLPVVLAVLVATLVPPQPSSAQEPDTTATLPTIAPREVEIRGELEIAFPSLERQPLIGFNPPPRVPEFPADREPYTGDYDEARVDLPERALQRPEPPSSRSLSTYPPIRGEIEALGGRYADRRVYGRTHIPVAPRTSLQADLDYHGTNGHAPFEERALSDAVQATVGIRTTRSQLAAGGSLDGFFESYRLYGALRSASSSLFPEEHPEREGRHLGGTVWLRTAGGTPVTARGRLRAATTHVETRHLYAGIDIPALDERRLAFDGSIALPVSTYELSLDASVAGAGLEGDGYTGSTYVANSGAGLHFTYDEYTVSLGARILAFSDASGQLTPGQTKYVYLSPDVRLAWTPRPRLRLYVQNRPGTSTHALADLQSEHPYVVPHPVLRPTIRTVDAEAGATFSVGQVRARARAGGQHVPHLRFFERARTGTPLGYPAGFSTVRYEEARVLHAGADVSVALPQGLHASTGLTVRRATLTEDDVLVPYVAPVSGHAAVSYSFLESRGLVQVQGRYEGSRYVDRSETDSVAPYVNVDVEASYNLNDTFGLVARVDNLVTAHTERWERYPEPPFTVSAGLRLLW